MKYDPEARANMVAIPSHVLDGIRLTLRSMYVFGEEPSVITVMAGATALGLDEQYRIVEWLVDHPRAYDQGMTHGFIPWDVN